jgi:hypothetical protein
MQYSLAYQLGERSGGLDPDAKAYIAAVEFEDGQALESGVRKAINNFVVGCKGDGIWSAIKASCILAGARTLDGALVPLVGTAPTNNNFVSGDYNRETGLVGDGSTKYLNSNRNNNADPQNDNHNAVWATSIQNELDKAFIGAGGTSSGTNIIAAAGDSIPNLNRIYTRNRSNTAQLTVNTAVTGLIAMSRSNSSNYIFRSNGSNITQNQTSQTSYNGNIGVFSRESGGSFGLFASHRLSFYSIGESLDLALLDTRVSTLMTDLAAAIP